MPASILGEIPQGVELVSLRPHHDSRGTFTEIFRDGWLDGPRTVQWNLVCSQRGVMRGVHVHRRHFDYLTVSSGLMHLGLSDLRAACPSHRKAALLELKPGTAVWIPPGVAHGFYFPEPSSIVFAVTEYWSPDDELGCRWSDPSLGIPWDVRDPLLSERDAALPSLDFLLKQLS